MTAVIVGALSLGLVAVSLLARRRRQAAKAQLAARESALAFTIDLMTVVLGSGGTIRDAVATVAREGPVPVRAGFQQVLDRSISGSLLVDALASASEPLGPAYHPLIGALAASERDGAPLSSLLQRLADEADQARRWQSEAQLRRLPVRLLVPLVLCQLPAVVLGAVVPLAIVALRQLR